MLVHYIERKKVSRIRMGYTVWWDEVICKSWVYGRASMFWGAAYNHVCRSIVTVRTLLLMALLLMLPLHRTNGQTSAPYHLYCVCVCVRVCVCVLCTMHHFKSPIIFKIKCTVAGTDAEEREKKKLTITFVVLYIRYICVLIGWHTWAYVGNVYPLPMAKWSSWTIA